MGRGDGRHAGPAAALRHRHLDESARRPAAPLRERGRGRLWRCQHDDVELVFTLAQRGGRLGRGVAEHDAAAEGRRPRHHRLHQVHPTTVAYEQGPAVPPFEIYVVRSDGSGLRRLAAHARGPAWSPDGTRIAYTSFSRGGVWVMNADGSGKRRVTPAPGGVEWVAWSPDGRQILFSSTAFSGVPTLVVVNSDGTGLRSVFGRSLGDSGYSPAWAPGGRIFFGRRSGSLGEICSVDPDGRGLTVVTATQIPANFSLSRDGKWLAIWDGDSDRLVRMAANGRGLAVALVDEVSQYRGGGALSSWSPNGGQLVVRQGLTGVAGARGCSQRRQGRRLGRVEGAQHGGCLRPGLAARVAGAARMMEATRATCPPASALVLGDLGAHVCVVASGPCPGPPAGGFGLGRRRAIRSSTRKGSAVSLLRLRSLQRLGAEGARGARTR